jgi:D-alanyl-D-alanine carboxypeptidase
MASNGRLPASSLARCHTTPPQRLSAGGAAAWDNLNNEYHRRHGSWLRLTDSYRPYTVQERIFRDRYTTTVLPGRPFKTWQGRRWYQKPGTAMAATPGTSKHGWGNAVDVTSLGGFQGTAYRRLAAIAGAYGFNNTVGQRIKEPWHWEYTGGGAPIPPPGEEDMDATQNQRLINAEKAASNAEKNAYRAVRLAEAELQPRLDALTVKVDALTATVQQVADRIGKETTP